ncbi:uridine kinase family protein [Pseudonocardia sp. HH130630-07]|uniref:uridine kinase family protein n=1 Tax=Pseudonocardia sp. HH130630-07 TaxID=1690815 RepID=UPI000814F4AC|nr:AAA family ATPase [Pseudonocardia sp. HH130630-07]ANY06854.1 hypothetical protein AFB00_11735 [Pseudonocardia sp. HH130630-07]
MVPDERSVAPVAAAGQGAAAVLLARLRQGKAPGHRPLFVGIDGRSGSGKSTLTARVAREFGGPVTVIEGDDFYGGGSAATWDRRTTAERVDLVLDWRRQHDVLTRLRADGAAGWRAFDWDSEGWDGEVAPLAAATTTVRIAPLVVLEGAYSCRPELHGLLDLRVLLTAPAEVRRRRLVEREGAEYDEDWAVRWSTAEDHYFGTVMPAGSFDLVL